jgi:hypothetical protein
VLQGLEETGVRCNAPVEQGARRRVTDGRQCFLEVLKLTNAEPRLFHERRDQTSLTRSTAEHIDQEVVTRRSERWL